MNAKAMTTAKVQCTGDDPQCNIAMQNASAQCEQEGGGGEGVNSKCAELTMANLGAVRAAEP